MPTKRSCIDFPRHARLLLPAEYNRIFAAGKRFSGACVTFVVARQALSESGSLVSVAIPRSGINCEAETKFLQRSPQRPRLGLALAKKQIKRAHERNRVKRFLRECFRANTQRLTGLEFVVMAKSAAQKTPNSALRSEIERLFSKAIDFFAALPITETDAHAPVIVSKTPQPHKNSEL